MNRIQIFNLKNIFIKLNKYICIQIFNLKNTTVRFGIQNATVYITHILIFNIKLFYLRIFYLV